MWGQSLIDTSVVNNALTEGKKILAEGAQGSMLDIDFGTYPYVTSSNTISAGVCSGLGIAPNKIRDVIGIAKAYCTRVGSGPFPTELLDDTGEKLRQVGKEFGATTGRPRRCGWIDIPQLLYTIMLNGVTQVIITKLDVLDTFEERSVATAYKYDQMISEELPYDIVGKPIEPQYATYEGWFENLMMSGNMMIDGDRFLVGEEESASGFDESTPLIRIDPTGAVVSSIYTGGHQELSRCVITVSDGGIACGETRRADDNVHQAFQVKKLDADGLPACEVQSLALTRTAHLPDTLSFPLEALGAKPMLRVDRPLTTWPLNIFMDGCSTIGIEGPENVAEPGIHPAPATDRLTITGIHGNVLVRMYDMNGRLVLDQRQLGSTTVDVSALPGGCYAVHISADQVVWRTSVVIARD